MVYEVVYCCPTDKQQHMKHVLMCNKLIKFIRDGDKTHKEVMKHMKMQNCPLKDLVNDINKHIYCITMYDVDTTKEEGWTTMDTYYHLERDVEFLIGLSFGVFKDVSESH